MKTFPFFIILLALSFQGCEKQVTNTLTLTNVSFYIPNIINIDNENNNVLYPSLRDGSSPNVDLIVEFMEVYDRSGSLIFQNEQFPLDEPEFGWNGTFDGSLVEQDTYTYSIKITDGVEFVFFTGDTTVLR